MASSPLAPSWSAQPSVVTDPADAVLRIIDGYDREAIGLVTAGDKLLTALRDQGLVQDGLHLSPIMVGCDLANRGSEGLNALEVNALADDIIAVGFSWAACAHAMCIEERPGSTEIEDFTSRLCADTNLAAVMPGSIKYGALACCHTNQLLRNIHYGAPSVNPNMSEQGSYNVDRLQAHDATYAAAVRNGLKWTVLNWRVRIMYPQVCDIIQASRNVGATLNRMESENQVLMKLHKLAAAHSQGDVPWALIKRQVMRTRPQCAEKLDAMITFVIARSGGRSAEHLLYLSVFFRTLVKASKRTGVADKLYSALADFPHHWLAIALYETAWTCPDAFIQHGECVFVGGAEVMELAKLLCAHSADPQSAAPRAVVVKACCDFLELARSLAKEFLPVTWDKLTNKQVAALARLDTLVGRFVLNKQAHDDHFESLSAIGEDFVKRFIAAVPGARRDAFKDLGLFDDDQRAGIETKTAAPSKSHHPTNKSTSAPSSAADLRLYELDAQGNSVSGVARLREKGFDKGSLVTLLEPPAEYAQTDVFKVVGIDNKVHLCLCDDATRVFEFTVDLFIDTASNAAGALIDREVFHPAWPNKRIMYLPAVAQAFARARVWSALETLSTVYADRAPELVDILVKPKKEIRSKGSIAPGELVLVPEATGMKLLRGAEAIEEASKQNAVEVLIPSPPKGFTGDRIFLTGANVDAACAPFWSVDCTERIDEVNLEPVHMRIQCVSGGDAVDEQHAGEPAVRQAEMHETLGALTDEDANISNCVIIPVLVNSQAVDPGEPLRTMKVDTAKKRKVTATIGIGKIMKLAKLH